MNVNDLLSKREKKRSHLSNPVEICRDDIDGMASPPGCSKMNMNMDTDVVNDCDGVQWELEVVVRLVVDSDMTQIEDVAQGIESEGAVADWGVAQKHADGEAVAEVVVVVRAEIYMVEQGDVG